METKIPHVVILGGGFAGLSAARGLARSSVKVTLIDRRNHHLFQPLLYQVATAGLSSPDIAAPLRTILRGQKNVTILMAEVAAVEADAKQLRLEDGSSLSYDYLLLATGATHAYFGNDEWATAAPGLKTLEDALEIRRRMLMGFEQAEAETDPAICKSLLTFVIVGAGPTGVELAGTLAEIARHTLLNEFRHIDPSSARVCLVEAGPRVLAAFPEVLSEKAKVQLSKLGVEVLTNCKVEAIDDHGVQINGERIEARTVIWAAGVAASPLGKSLGVPLDRAGRVQVGDDLRVPGHPEIFVAGDLAAVMQDGKPLPGLAPVAKQMGAYVAKAIQAQEQGKTLPGFRYKHAGSMATIGRMAAVADMGAFHLSGLLAWWFWLLVHILFLIGFRNRIIVLINWAWAYWTYQRHARIILDRETGKKH